MIAVRVPLICPKRLQIIDFVADSSRIGQAVVVLRKVLTSTSSAQRQIGMRIT